MCDRRFNHQWISAAVYVVCWHRDKYVISGIAAGNIINETDIHALTDKQCPLSVLNHNIFHCKGKKQEMTFDVKLNRSSCNKLGAPAQGGVKYFPTLVALCYCGCWLPLHQNNKDRILKNWFNVSTSEQTVKQTPVMWLIVDAKHSSSKAVSTFTSLMLLWTQGLNSLVLVGYRG